MTNQSHQAPQVGSIRIRGQDIPTITKDIEQSKLKFFVDNPRIYTFVRGDGKVPTQKEIYEELLDHEHVRVLKEDIVANGGLMDPLIVRDGDLVVLEGNSRLAACRFLASKDPLRWEKVRCTVLPAGIDEKLIFALLGQYHIKGKKDWVPYEKAGFLYRRHKGHQIELSAVAAELGILPSEARHLVAVYEFMIEHKDADRDHWSYYDEYLKSTRIKKARDEYPTFDKFIVSEVQAGRIPKAMDLRDKLPIICTASAKILKRYADGKISFADAHEDAVDSGGDHPALKKLKRFRNWLALSETEEDLLEVNKTLRDKAHFELKEIEKRARKLKELLEKSKSQIT